MTLAELFLQVHIGLQTDNKVVRWGDGHASVINVNRPDHGKIFKMVKSPEGGGYPHFVTQNIAKPSANTRWIKEDPEHRAMTWMFTEDGYGGCIRTWVDHRSGNSECQITMFNLGGILLP